MEAATAERPRERERVLPNFGETVPAPPPPSSRGRTAIAVGSFILFTAVLVAVKGVFLTRDIVSLCLVAGLRAFSAADLGGSVDGVIRDWLPFFGALFAYDYLRGLAEGAVFEPHTLPQIRVDEWLFAGA